MATSSLQREKQSPPPVLRLFPTISNPSLDEFHDKHGRRTGGKTRKKNAGSPAPSQPDPAVVSCRSSNGNNETDKSTSDPGRESPAAAGERCEPDGGKTGTSLPAIGPSPPPAVPKGGINGTQDVVISAEVNPARTAESGSSVGGDEESSAVSLAQAASPRSCVCCGGEGGRGHGRRCEHTFRRCGFCRVEEVRRVLGIRDKRRRESGDTRAQASEGRRGSFRSFARNVIRTSIESSMRCLRVQKQGRKFPVEYLKWSLFYSPSFSGPVFVSSPLVLSIFAAHDLLA